MVLSAIAWTFSWSAILFALAPRYPYYQITEIRLVSISVLNLLLRWVITCTVEADVEIDSANFIGAEVHSAIMDIYYSDGDGLLRHIGDLRDKHTYQQQHHHRLVHARNNILHMDWMGDENAATSCFVPTTSTTNSTNTYSPNFQMDDGHGGKSLSNENHVKESCDENLMKRRQRVENPSPFFLPPRSKAVMHDNVISVYELRPSISLSLLREFFRSPFGEIRMLSAGVAHVKTSPPSVPATVAVMCDHRINALVFPARIVDRTCSPVEIIPGWSNKDDLRFKLSNEMTKRFEAHGSVLNEFDLLLETTNHQRDELQSVEEWYDF